MPSVSPGIVAQVRAWVQPGPETIATPRTNAFRSTSACVTARPFTVTFSNRTPSTACASSKPFSSMRGESPRASMPRKVTPSM